MLSKGVSDPALSMLKERTVRILLVFNGILLVASWVMSFVAYSQLPERFPLLVDFLGRALMELDRSPLFFLSPLLQSGLFVVLLWFAQRISMRQKLEKKSHILREACLLIFIFIQLVFIHVQRTLIYLAHGIDQGFNPVYFYGLFAIILVLVPYFRLRLKLIG